MTDSCCPRLKQIQATIVRYNPNRNSSKPNTNVDSVPVCLQAAQEGEEFQKRVSNLRSKLEEANANITLLRTWVGETDEAIKEAKPKGPKEMIDYLKSLILKLDECQRQIEELAEKGVESMQNLDEVENQGCYCALASDSCENIKKQLTDIAGQKEALDDTINQIKDHKKSSSAPVPGEIIDTIKKDISGVKSCVDSSCPKRNSSKEKPPALMETGIQNNIAAPPRKPKLSQTNANPKWNQGTDARCHASRCCQSNT